MESIHILQDVFSKNRAEEIGYDVWEHFVVPPFYDKLDLETARKPRVIIGGRGCGKTMLLRYFSHQSKFSLSREKIPEEAISHIGLYWRADTQFCNAMTQRGLPDDTWNSAFSHFAALLLGMELLDSLESIANSAFRPFDKAALSAIDFGRLSAFGLPPLHSDRELYQYLECLMWGFEAWVNDVRKIKEPSFLPGPNFIHAMIKTVQQQVPAFESSAFFVYLDEYENLCEYQKRIINTWLKHSEAPLLFNLAMKRNSFDTRETMGNESISDIHDFRQHDLEAYLLENNFQVFAAEILFLKLSFTPFKSEKSPTRAEVLRDPSALSLRRKSSYIQRILKAAQDYFPDVNQADLARTVFQDQSLYHKLRGRVEIALSKRSSTLPPEAFIRDSLPEASIVNTALLYRRKLRPEIVAAEMDRLERGEANKFTGSTAWIHNNFVGSVLNLYSPFSRPCPFYAGFNTFCHLSNGNLRHFIELCYKSISRAVDEQGLLVLPVEPERQAEAARQASADFLREVRSFGPIGNNLHTFVLRLGSLFALAHQRATQSESEQSHFSITKGKKELTQEGVCFFREATKWAVLFEDPETKRKQKEQPQNLEYILNPIYAPYFHISYRKKKKLELSTEEVMCLIKGSLDDFSKLMRKFSTGWEIGSEETEPTLFSFVEAKSENED